MPTTEELAAHELDYDPPLDVLEKYRAEQLERERRRSEYREREMADTNAQRIRDWEAWLAGHLENERKLLIESIGRGVGEIREQLRAEFKAELANYARRGDETVKELRQALARAKAFNTGEIVDITPSPVIRKTKNDAA